ncbi:hypothetical protein [Ulvibacterium sp.]|uniref:hypothetical protein n=1 Tax=Ulvibacterium sp. TaxID=2665914 RepID=UPI0026151651|nr:hypothetical protein [Ulvibacterium sp.]
MYKYRSSSRFKIFDTVVATLMFIGIGYAVIATTNNIAAQISVAMVVLFISLWIAHRSRNRIFDVEFKEQFIVVDHVFKPDNARILYENIIELQFISVNKSPTFNKMIFNYGEKQETIRFKTIARGDEFIDFVKWLKSKNDKIKVSVYPPDHYMNHRLQKEYGFNYRKVPKID